MDIEKILKATEPILKVAIDGNVISKALLRHYLKSMSTLTGKTEDEIKKEIIEIEKTIREELTTEFKNRDKS